MKPGGFFSCCISLSDLRIPKGDFEGLWSPLFPTLHVWISAQKSGSEWSVGKQPQELTQKCWKLHRSRSSSLRITGQVGKLQLHRLDIFGSNSWNLTKRLQCTGACSIQILAWKMLWNALNRTWLVMACNRHSIHGSGTPDFGLATTCYKGHVFGPLVVPSYDKLFSESLGLVFVTSSFESVVCHQFGEFGDCLEPWAWAYSQGHTTFSGGHPTIPRAQGCEGRPQARTDRRETTSPECNAHILSLGKAKWGRSEELSYVAMVPWLACYPQKCPGK